MARRCRARDYHRVAGLYRLPTQCSVSSRTLPLVDDRLDDRESTSYRYEIDIFSALASTYLLRVFFLLSDRQPHKFIARPAVRIEMGLRIVAAGAAFLVCMSEGALSQAPTQAGQALPNDIAVTLTSGTVVRIRNIAIFRGQKSSELVVYIETPTPSAEPARLASEAKELAGLQIKGPMTSNLASVSVAVCRTTTCLQMQEKPEELFVFVRNADGSLEAENPPSLPLTSL
jgi:hypothetical protein